MFVFGFLGDGLGFLGKQRPIIFSCRPWGTAAAVKEEEEEEEVFQAQ